MRFCFVLLAAFFLGCSNEQKPTEEIILSERLQDRPDVDTTTTPESPHDRAVLQAVIQRSVDSLIKDAEVKYKTKYSTLAQVMRKLFSEGSTKGEVLQVQGPPNTKQFMDNVEIWVYGNCEVHFEQNYVKEVYAEGCRNLKYKGTGDLQLSDDYLEKEFSNFLISREVRQRY